MDERVDTSSQEWARLLETHGKHLRRIRRVMRSLPSDPRCSLCYAPFRGVGGKMLRLSGYRPSKKAPMLCDKCVEAGPDGGFETEGGVLFADVRGFTALAETMTPTESAALLERFYAAAGHVLPAHDGIIDKLVGDEVMALFWPLVIEDEPIPTMVRAGEELLRAVGYGTDAGPWLPLGVGMHFGTTFFGNVRGATMREFTALGDVVNTASRLQAAAAPGQMVLSERVYREVADRYPDAQAVELELKGKREPFAARVVEAAAPVAATAG